MEQQNKARNGIYSRILSADLFLPFENLETRKKRRHLSCVSLNHLSLQTFFTGSVTDERRVKTLLCTVCYLQLLHKKRIKVMVFV